MLNKLVFVLGLMQANGGVPSWVIGSPICGALVFQQVLRSAVCHFSLRRKPSSYISVMFQMY